MPTTTGTLSKETTLVQFSVFAATLFKALKEKELVRVDRVY
jgi:hypothetical protein